MRTIKINDRFESLGRFQIRHRVAFLVVLAVFTIIGCLGLPRLKLSIGKITVKAEGAWYPKRDKVACAMFGLEWMKNDITFIGELYGSWDKKAEKLSCQTGGSISWDLLDGDLQLSAAGILELNELDGASILGVSYSFTDELKAMAQVVYVFEGTDEPGTYGAFNDLDCVGFGLTYSF